MRDTGAILGRDAELEQVSALLGAGRSVLLYGPEGVGKSALVESVRTPALTVLDPWLRASPFRAAEIRRALNRGAVYLAATRTTPGPSLGAVGRILGRFTLVRVRELPTAVIRDIIVRALTQPTPPFDLAWIAEMATLARGRPGVAVSMADFVNDWQKQRGYLPLPPLAYAAARGNAAIASLVSSRRMVSRLDL